MTDMTDITRVYESGHEVPFYQPLLSLEIFTRAINGLDIATGKVRPDNKFFTKGTLKSEYREGNRTMQFEVLPKNSTYNYTTGAPNDAPEELESEEYLKVQLTKERE